MARIVIASILVIFAIIIAIAIQLGVPSEVAWSIVFGGGLTAISFFFAFRGYLEGRRDPSPRIECPKCKSTKIKPFTWKKISGKMVLQWKCDKCKAVYIPGSKVNEGEKDQTR